MEFKHSATYPHSFEEVVSKNYSEDFIHSLDNIQDVSTPKVTSLTEENGVITCITAWEYEGELEMAERAVLGTKTLTWEQIITVDKNTKTGTIHIEYANGKPPGTLDGKITYTEEDGVTTRTIDGDIVVKIMFIGPQVEKKLRDKIGLRFDAEAAAVNEALS